MTPIAYLANQFPSPFEPYIAEEILSLRGHGLEVLPGSAWKAKPDEQLWSGGEILTLQPLHISVLIRATWLGLHRIPLLRDLLRRIVLQGKETASTRFRALAHTLLGLYYAVLLQGRSVQHIHVHHGYFSSWIAMVAAR